jgi:hypothetical protein
LRKRRSNLREVSFPLWERKGIQEKPKMIEKNVKDKKNSDVKRESLTRAEGELREDLEEQKKPKKKGGLRQSKAEE